jgi:hypothetical protein
MIWHLAPFHPKDNTLCCDRPVKELLSLGAGHGFTSNENTCNCKLEEGN